VSTAKKNIVESLGDCRIKLIYLRTSILKKLDSISLVVIEEFDIALLAEHLDLSAEGLVWWIGLMPKSSVPDKKYFSCRAGSQDLDKEFWILDPNLGPLFL
jgi:hypothetical protein